METPSTKSQNLLVTPENITGSAHFKHYELRTRLGEDDFGVEFIAWDTKLLREVALKFLKGAMDDERTNMLVSEARLLASLQHYAFLKTHAIEQAGHSIAIVTELAMGVSLKEWLQNNYCSETRALNFVTQVATALQEAHVVGLVHGDLKPTNLMIDASGKLRFLHFQGARNADLSASSVQGQIDANGSLAYMAPERFSHARPTAQSDVYALGTILYELLHRSLPFAALNGLALVAAQVQSSSETWNWPETISPVVRQLILGMTSRDEHERLNSGQVVEECQKLAQNNPSSSSSASLSLTVIQAKLAKDAQRRQWRNVALFAGLLGIASLAAWQTKPYWPQIVKAVTPFSESREMEKGVAALTEYVNRPRSILLDTAQEHFSSVIEHHPEHAAAVAYLSLVFMHRYQSEKRDEIWLQKAKASAQQALKLNEKLAVSKLANAKILQWHHKLALALEECNAALVLEPKNIFVWQTKMSTLLELKRFDAAIDLANQAEVLFPNERFILDLKAGIYIGLFQYQAAEKTLRLSLQRQPDSALAYALLATAVKLQGRVDEALQVIQQGLQVRPSANLYEALGEIKVMQADYSGAAAAFADAVSPTKGIAGSYVRWIRFAEACMWVPERKNEGLEAFEKARSLLEIRLNRSPADGTLMVYMSHILARLGDFAQAKALMEKAVAIAPEDPERLYRAGLTAELIGERNMALAYIAEANRLGYPAMEITGNPILKALRSDPRYR